MRPEDEDAAGRVRLTVVSLGAPCRAGDDVAVVGGTTSSTTRARHSLLAGRL